MLIIIGYCSCGKKQPPGVLYKKDVLKNFPKFTGKHLCWILFFSKVAGLEACNFIKKEIFKNTFLQKISGGCFYMNRFLQVCDEDIKKESEAATGGILLKKALRLATLLKKRLWHKCFSMSFAKFLRAPFFTEHFWWLLLENHKDILLVLVLLT